MIRRDIRLADGSAGWMLISQIEHARISAELAAHCTARFDDPAKRAGSSPTPADAPNNFAEVRDEVLAAILHHDDGWREWDRDPQLDSEDGRPLAFTEIAHIDAMDVWSRSIDAAARIGPLAAWMVAGHFLRLVRQSMQAGRCDPVVGEWSVQTARRRAGRITDWELSDPKRHTPQLSNEAFQWLWTFDEVSLWLCCTCNPNEPIPCAPEPYWAGRGTPIHMELQAGGPELAVIRPWRFDQETLEITISGKQLPAAHYRNSAELQAASVPASLKWRLAKEK